MDADLLQEGLAVGLVHSLGLLHLLLLQFLDLLVLLLLDLALHLCDFVVETFSFGDFLLDLGDVLFLDRGEDEVLDDLEEGVVDGLGVFEESEEELFEAVLVFFVQNAVCVAHHLVLDLLVQVLADVLGAALQNAEQHLLDVLVHGGHKQDLLDGPPLGPFRLALLQVGGVGGHVGLLHVGTVQVASLGGAVHVARGHV